MGFNEYGELGDWFCIFCNQEKRPINRCICQNKKNTRMDLTKENKTGDEK